MAISVPKQTIILLQYMYYEDNKVHSFKLWISCGLAWFGLAMVLSIVWPWI